MHHIFRLAKHSFNPMCVATSSHPHSKAVASEPGSDAVAAKASARHRRSENTPFGRVELQILTGLDLLMEKKVKRFT